VAQSLAEIATARLCAVLQLTVIRLQTMCRDYTGPRGAVNATFFSAPGYASTLAMLDSRD
jgi:hypothetical protein